MRYVGGKSKLARQIAATILGATDDRACYIEPFVGGGSVLAQMAPHFVRSYVGDASEIALMWDALVREGWRPPEIVTEQEYAALKDADPSALRAFVGFGGSFGGKFFGGYARGGYRSNGEPRNHQGESARAVSRIADAISGSDVIVYQTDYRYWTPQSGDVVYCDPPYRDTQGYPVGAFDSDEFWSVVSHWARNGAHVFVSEYTAPKDWTCVWEATHRLSLTQPSQGRGERIERLFTMEVA